ncbi:MAG TPA: lytic murein transglycosylase B [Burkholderiales bacterium]|nr:lytic murein transglycosylase B [Burkholderiales bacterium]
MKGAAAALLWALCLIAGAPARAQGYDTRPEVRAFVDEMVARHGFLEDELRAVFARAQRVEPALQSIRPEQQPTWAEFRSQFVNDKRIAAGLEFWRANRASLARAERDYGVPAQYVVAIIGVETYYGRHSGRWRVVDALTTLAFDYPARAPFFRSELEQFLLFARDNGIDVFSVNGSYAGAIGIPQFMPGSARRYAVDFDGNGSIDLRGSAADAIGSVANFLLRHGWHPGEPVQLRVSEIAGDAWRAYADGAVRPAHSVAELAEAGLRTERGVPSDTTPAAVIDLAGDLRLGLHNFYVITRYNRSALYAGAVADLAEALVERRRPARQRAGK